MESGVGSRGTGVVSCLRVGRRVDGECRAPDSVTFSYGSAGVSILQERESRGIFGGSAGAGAERAARSSERASEREREDEERSWAGNGGDQSFRFDSTLRANLGSDVVGAARRLLARCRRAPDPGSAWIIRCLSFDAFPHSPSIVLTSLSAISAVAFHFYVRQPISAAADVVRCRRCRR